MKRNSDRTGPGPEEFETISSLADHDFRLSIGYFVMHHQTWGVIGRWNPEGQTQLRPF